MTPGRATEPRYPSGVDWVYFLVTDSGDGVRLIVRRNGPAVQLLTPDGWIDWPQLLPRFLDADYLEEASAVAAQNAALEARLPWTP